MHEVAIKAARRLIKRGLAETLWAMGHYRKILRSITAPIILKYHRFSSISDTRWNSSDYADFEKGIGAKYFDGHLRLIRQFRKPITMCELSHAITHGHSLPERAVAITVDDGYKDNFEVAYPLLKQHGVVATFFVCPGLIDNGQHYWWDDIYRYLRETRNAEIDIADLRRRTRGVGLSRQDRFSLRTPQGRHRAASEISYLFKRAPQGALPDLMEQLRNKLGLDAYNNCAASLLTWSQIIEMSNHGMDFGSHTMTHPMLSQLTEGQIRSEVDESKRRLSEVLGRPVKGLVYPSGDFDCATRKVVTDCGYEYACTSEIGFVMPSSNVFALKRIELPNAGLAVSVRDAVLTWRYAQSK